MKASVAEPLQQVVLVLVLALVVREPGAVQLVEAPVEGPVDDDGDDEAVSRTRNRSQDQDHTQHRNKLVEGESWSHMVDMAGDSAAGSHRYGEDLLLELLLELELEQRWHCLQKRPQRATNEGVSF